MSEFELQYGRFKGQSSCDVQALSRTVKSIIVLENIEDISMNKNYKNMITSMIYDIDKSVTGAVVVSGVRCSIISSILNFLTRGKSSAKGSLGFIFHE